MVHHWPWLIIWKWHFWEKIVLKGELLHFLSTFISGNKYHRWAQQSFLELTVLLSNSSGEKKHQFYWEACPRSKCSLQQRFQIADLSSTQLVSAKFTERQTHRPQLKFLTQPVPKTVVQFNRIDNSKKPETVTRHCLNVCPNKPLSSYLWWPMMKSNFYPFFRF